MASCREQAAKNLDSKNPIDSRGLSAREDLALAKTSPRSTLLRDKDLQGV